MFKNRCGQNMQRRTVSPAPPPSPCSPTSIQERRSRWALPVRRIRATALARSGFPLESTRASSCGPRLASLRAGRPSGGHRIPMVSRLGFNRGTPQRSGSSALGPPSVPTTIYPNPFCATTQAAEGIAIAEVIQQNTDSKSSKDESPQALYEMLSHGHRCSRYIYWPFQPAFRMQSER